MDTKEVFSHGLGKGHLFLGMKIKVGCCVWISKTTLGELTFTFYSYVCGVNIKMGQELFRLNKPTSTSEWQQADSEQTD